MHAEALTMSVNATVAAHTLPALHTYDDCAVHTVSVLLIAMQVMDKLLGEIAELVGPIRAALGSDNVQVAKTRKWSQFICCIQYITLQA
jgi:hypothetical protein